MESYLISHRLPRSSKPVNYKLYLEPDLEKFTFAGSAQIDINIVERTNLIVLNSKNLSIRTIFLDSQKVNGYELIEQDEILVIKLGFFLEPGNSHILIIAYDGILNNHMEGFYRSQYTVDGQTRYIATTQFESTDARQAFPCYDEPDFKATFDVTIRARSDLAILSNTSESNILDNGDGTKTSSFKQTPIMSTYLVAFIVGDLDYIETYTNNIRVRAYATRANKSKLAFPLDISARALAWFIDWFQIDYPIDKVDMVAIPDFSAGAMENWGLITYRETSMLCDETTELNEKQNIVNTIAHELAHQWFGNLVTMEWWTYLWLNESMATYFGWLVSDHLFPEWKIWDKFISSEFATALQLDSLANSHPIEVPIQKSNDIQQIFDAISYSKGSCLVRFLVDYLGPEKFRTGMQKYMRTHAYSNTTSKDLFDAFGDGIHDIMNTWLSQTGYPIVQVSRSGSVLKLRQERFFRTKPDTLDSTLWVIPVKIGGKYHIFSERERSFDISGIDDIDLAINENRIGFFRTQYIDYDFSTISQANVAYALSDSWALSQGGYQSIAQPFTILKNINLDAVSDYKTWSVVLANLEILHRNLTYYPFLQKVYESKIKSVLESARSRLNNLGLDPVSDETINDYELRLDIINSLIYYGDTDLTNELLERFRTGKMDHMKSTIYFVAGKYGSKSDYDNLMGIFETTDDQNISDYVLDSLAAVQSEELISKSLALVLSGKIRDQNLVFYIRSLSANKHITDSIFDLVTSNFDKFLKMFPIGGSMINYLVKTMGCGFMRRDQLSRYIDFFNVHPIEGAEMCISQMIEGIGNKIKIIDGLVNSPEFLGLQFVCSFDVVNEL